MSGTLNRNVTTSTMVVSKAKKEAELSLEEKKAALELELEEKAAEKAKLEADIAEQKRLKTEQDAAELAEKLKRSEQEEAYFLEQAQEQAEKRKKLLAQSGSSEAKLEPAVLEPIIADFELKSDESVKSAAEQIQETVKEIKESQIAAGEAKPFEDYIGYHTDHAITDEHVEIKPIGFWAKVKAVLRKSLTSLQVIAMILFLSFSWGGFKYYEWKIDKFNASLNDEQLLTQKINAYNDSNIQRVFFEAGNIGIKVLLALVILFIISPMTVKYIVPFLSGKVNFSEDFVNVQPWVRLIIVCVLFFSVLLFLGLMATVNTY